MEVMKETSCRSRFALLISSVDSRRNGKGRRCIEPSRLPVKQMKRVLKKRKLRKIIRNYILKNVPKSKVYQIIRAPFLRKTVVFANGERITEINEFGMIKKYPFRNEKKRRSFLMGENKKLVKKGNEVNSLVVSS